MSNFVIETSDRIKRLPPYLFGQLNALKLKKRQEDIDIIDLGMGNPMDGAPKLVIDKLCEAAQDPRNHRYISASKGVFNLGARWP
jgi:alanine-synthesizing transaminase